MTVEVKIHDKMRGTEETWEHPGPVTAQIANGQLILNCDVSLLGRWKLTGNAAGVPLVAE